MFLSTAIETSDLPAFIPDVALPIPAKSTDSPREGAPARWELKEAANLGGLSNSSRSIVRQISDDGALCTDNLIRTMRSSRICLDYDRRETAGSELEEDSILHDGIVFEAWDHFRAIVSLYLIAPAKVSVSGS